MTNPAVEFDADYGHPMHLTPPRRALVPTRTVVVVDLDGDGNGNVVVNL